jgi:hypothetical protein
MLSQQFFAARTLPTAAMLAAHRALHPTPATPARKPRQVFSYRSVGRTLRTICIGTPAPVPAVEAPVAASKFVADVPAQHETAWSNPKAIMLFIMAGKARVTLTDPATGTACTYMIKKASKRYAHKDRKYFVDLIGENGPGGVIDGQDIFRGNHAFQSHPATRLFANWFYDISEGHPSKIPAAHRDCCGKCGRPLTDPESMSSGIGPDCFEKIFGYPRPTSKVVSAPRKAPASKVAKPHTPKTDDQGLQAHFMRFADEQIKLKAAKIRGDLDAVLSATVASAVCRTEIQAMKPSLASLDALCAHVDEYVRVAMRRVLRLRSATRLAAHQTEVARYKAVSVLAGILANHVAEQAA